MNLTIINQDGKLSVDSREVAEAIGKEHKELLRSIRNYIEILTSAEMLPLNFFIPSEYIDSKKEARPCYLLTKKGCDMVANKMTGEKGVIFTAKYVTKFEEMEQHLTNNPKLPLTYKEALIQLVEQVDKNESLQLQNTQQAQIIGELKPKADYTDTILQNKGLVTITQIAKDYGMSGQEMNEKLHDLHVQYKQSDQWLLYREHHDKGYTHSNTIDILHKDGSRGVKMNTKWTQKGRLFIYELLKDHGIFPLIEL